MPELPEVETVRRGLEQKLNNFIIKKVEVCRDSTVAFPNKKEDFIGGLNNSLLYKWNRRGKYLIAELKKLGNENGRFPLEKFSKNNGFLIVHLRMTGYFKFINNSAQPCKHTRIRVFDNKNNELRYIDVRSFGQMWWIKEGLSPNKIIKGLGSLGPEPFSKDFDEIYLKKVISKRTKSIKAILLDQTIVAGIGNIYADESLYSAGISPFREARTIKKNELIKLKESIVTVLKNSIGSGGTTFSDFRDLEGENGNFGLQTNVYRRTGKECRKCGNLIERKKISGRSTHWCPKCQK
ncbi:Formamidopyrimidine-DNA glycolase (FAPY-DNA glycolase) [Prochlorococcus marinus str. MIT 9215]|uniref:Formamidopyrimidine-DNA glycosylase n=1 Tax=Prochlorococcus marinus (strain MIT 9215) TaxID=93060 RepID=FPG_PROM2|nr:DNA-formamidopyrimidine glycosylase [Prochlorococcus marinus]A8G2Y9.1 RecName: Full=Formamidopyrimidine-DNA glycosylase; Short=Fapy-DNA glycosylase; AltName: Full=DNA-(apurinic or apyrimidinic site) lyase MutM; Short=AP lyase MutM [Prochlorococcus marinus str. MIT 9215]ABV49970.1 Formamidopyrimidine-DNA glycolase (FAPY-DNA glycolase) [Prochlorococcus marinus str. MIT 9215]